MKTPVIAKIAALAAVAALAGCTDLKPLQAQVDTLKSQVSSLQSQVAAAKSAADGAGSAAASAASAASGAQSTANQALAANGLDKSAIDWLVPHQANIRIIQATAKKLDMPMEKVIVTVAEHGNTSSASVPLALDAGVRDGRIRRGQLLLLEAFGGGLTWGSALIRY